MHCINYGETNDMNDEIYEYLDDEAVVMPDFEEALIGTTTDGAAVYDYYKMLEILMTRDKMTEEEAADYISYNTIRALPYAGEMKPIVIYLMNGDEHNEPDI